MASNSSSSSSCWRCYQGEEFQEEDVWGVMEVDTDSGDQNNSLLVTKHGRASKTKVSTPRIMIPGGAPTNTAGNDKKITNGGGHHIGYDLGHHLPDRNVDDEEEDDDDEQIVPPHEYIARRLARTQISSSSVCEGVGKKLKGRELSEVRNAVLRKTGFLER